MFLKLIVTVSSRVLTMATLKVRPIYESNSILSELTLMLAWSAEEAGRILETYKSLEDKPPDLIMEKNNPDPHSKLVEALTSVKSVNKTDAATLIAAFGTLEAIVAASIEDLSMCPGFGPQKAQRLHKVLHEPFKRK